MLKIGLQSLIQGLLLFQIFNRSTLNAGDPPVAGGYAARKARVGSAKSSIRSQNARQVM